MGIFRRYCRGASSAAPSVWSKNLHSNLALTFPPETTKDVCVCVKTMAVQVPKKKEMLVSNASEDTMPRSDTVTFVIE